MTITNMLPHAVLVNQLSDGTTDGKPDEDARMNCVAASLSAGIHVLTGTTVYGDTLKDAVYGQGYVGMQAPAQYAASRELASLGVTMTPYGSTSGRALVAHIHSELQAGRPVLVTIPSLWATPVAQQKPGYTTHVVCMAGWGPSWLRAMNPWGGFWQDGDDTWWALRLCYGQVWSMSRKAGVASMAWTKQPDGTGKDAHGNMCGAGDMAYLANTGLAASDGLMSETFYDASSSFLPLDNGHIVTWDGKQVAEDGAQALVAIWQQLQAAKAGDNPPPDPLAQKALDLMTALAAFQKEL